MNEIAKRGVRRQAPEFRTMAVGVGGVSILALLAVSSFFPFVKEGLSPTAVAVWLAGLGSNVLATWLNEWAGRVSSRAISESTADERLLLIEMATDLQQHMATDDKVANAVASLLVRIEAIEEASVALRAEVNEQATLLAQINTDLLRSVHIQGRHYRFLISQLHTQYKLLEETYELVRSTDNVLHTFYNDWQNEVHPQQPIMVLPEAVHLNVDVGGWKPITSVTIHNRSRVRYYRVTVEVVVDTSGIHPDALGIDLVEPRPRLATQVGEITWYRDLIMLSMETQPGKRVILLVFEQLEPETIYSLEMTIQESYTPTTSAIINVFFRVASFSREPPTRYVR